MVDLPNLGGRLLNTKEAAALLNVSPRTMEDWRWRGGGPLFRKVGRRLVRYTMTDLLKFAGSEPYANTGIVNSSS